MRALEFFKRSAAAQMAKTPELPPLAFGDDYAVNESDYSATTAFLRSQLKFLPKTFMKYGSFEPVFGKKNWHRRHSPYFFQTKDLFIAAGSSSPYSIRVRGNGTDVAFLVGYIGSGQVITCDKEALKLVSGRSAVLVSNCGSLLEMGVQSGVYLRPDVDRLNKVARIMTGLREGESFDLGLSSEKQIELVHGNISIDMLFRQIWLMIDQILPNPKAFEMLGLDDIILRTIVMMLRPDIINDTEYSLRLSRSNQEIKSVQDYVYAHLEKPIRITDLEEITGLSQRTLHNLFKKTFNMSPMQWVQQQRLFLVRQKLMKASLTDNIGLIAENCGFANMGRFAKIYYERFGELPSETVKRNS